MNALKSRMEQIIATTPVVILTAEVDASLTVTFVSDHVKHLGYEPGEILGTPLFDPIRTHQDDREKLDRAIEVLFTDHQMIVKYRIRKQDGGFAWIQTNARLVINESGTPVEIVAGWTDITRQTQLEQKLEIFSGPVGKLGVWKKSGEVLGALVPSLTPQSWKLVQDCLQAAFRGETTSGVYLRLPRRDGAFLHGVLTAGPLQLGPGGIYEAVGAVIELSHEKQGLH